MNRFTTGNPYRCRLLRVDTVIGGRPAVARWIVTGTGKVMRRLPPIYKRA